MGYAAACCFSDLLLSVWRIAERSATSAAKNEANFPQRKLNWKKKEKLLLSALFFMLIKSKTDHRMYNTLQPRVFV